MRKLLYLAAGAALLLAPAAFAQDSSAPSDQPAPAASDPGQATTPSDQTGPSDPAAGPSDQVAPPDQGAPQAAPVDQGAAPNGAYNNQVQGQYSSPSQPAPGYYTQPPGQGPYGYGSKGANVRANESSRLYVQQGEYQGQGVQIISNAPVPDTRGVRRMYPPLSRAGRRTAPVGN